MHTLYTVVLLTLLSFDVCASSGEQQQHILAWRSELLSLEECFELPENSDSEELATKSKRRKGSSPKKNTQVSAKKLKEVHDGDRQLPGWFSGVADLSVDELSAEFE